MASPAQMLLFSYGLTNFITSPVSLGTAQGSAGASSVALTTGTNIPAGSLVVVGIQVGFGSAQTITGVSDGTNTYTRAAGAAWDATGDFVCELDSLVQCDSLDQ